MQRSEIIIGNGIAIYAGASTKTELHHHLAIQVVIAIRGSVKLFIEDKTVDEEVVLINSNVKHKHATQPDGLQISIFVDTFTELAKTIQSNKKNAFSIGKANHQSLNELVTSFFDKKPNMDLVVNFIGKTFGVNEKKHVRDERIDEMLLKLSRQDIETLGIEDIYNSLPLSKSRVRHLFKQNTGISIQRYILWLRLKQAMINFQTGETPTQSAYLSGFADYAHMSRTVKEMFGLSLKSIYQNSHSIQDLPLEQV